MYKVSTSIKLPLPPDVVFNILISTEGYPTIFPFYLKVEKIIEKKSYSVWKNTVLMNKGCFSVKGKPFTWSTKYIHTKNRKYIQTVEIKPKFPLKRLEAKWCIDNDINGTKVTLAHYYEAKFFLISKFIGFIINNNAKILLKNLKENTTNYNNENYSI